MLLRRSGVLRDVYPGDSDFDLTVVLDNEASAYAIAKILRGLKVLFPMLGETILLKEDDFGHYAQNRHASFWALRPQLVFARRDFQPEWRDTPQTHDLNLTLGEVVRNSLWPTFSQPSEDLIFSRDLFKMRGKKRWAEDPTGELCYQGASFPNKLYYSESARTKLAHSLHKEFAKGKEAEVSAQFPLLLVGEIAGPTMSELNTLRACVAPLFNHGMELRLQPFRLYHFSRCVTLFSENECDLSFLRPALEECARRLEKAPLVLAFSYVVPQDAQGQRIWRKHDPLAEALGGLKHWDLETGRESASSQPFQVTRKAIEYELSTSVALIHSVLRREDPVYLLTLFFGAILPWRTALESGRLFLSFEDYWREEGARYPNAEQCEVAGLFAEGDLEKLQKLKSLDLYQILASWIEPELKRARALLDSPYAK